MTYQELIPYILKGKRVRYGSNCSWIQMEPNGDWIYPQTNQSAVVTMGDMKANTWEVRPDPIYLWGAQDSDGDNYMYQVEPTLDNTGMWFSGGNCISTDTPFSQTKTTKFELKEVK